VLNGTRCATWREYGDSISLFRISGALTWCLRLNSNAGRFRHRRSLDVVARASRVDLLSLMNLGKVAPQVGIKFESDSTKSEMVRNGRCPCDQIDAAGGVHTTAADELRFLT